MNGSQGIQPTIELATTNGNGFYPYPYVYGNGNNGNGFFGGDGIWALVLLALLFNGNNGFGGFGGNGNNDFAWLSNGQKEIMNNTNNGFDTLHLSNQLEGNRDAINELSNQICSSTASINGTISNGFYNTEISANNRAINQMQDTFALSRQFADCCCENRLATCQTQNIVQNEGNATRFADANNTRDIITNATANTQAILDKLCQLELDAKNDKISDLQREVLMKDLQASQTSQNAFIAQGFANEVDQLYNRLSNCPVPSTPVYGRTPIFTCPNNNGCGCGNYYGANIM
jgi:hypothetical protein